jgi:ABC-type antimicrobial peptide transport system permease subunit
LGVAVSAVGAQVLAQVLGWSVRLPPFAVVLAVGSAVGVGLFFGFFPAWRASRLDPIEALRHE